MGKIIKVVEVELDKVRHLLFDMNSWYDIEDKTGLNLKNFDIEKLKISHLRVVIWACLRHEEPELTIENVGSMIDLGNLDYISGKLNEMFSLHGGQVEVNDSDNPSKDGDGKGANDAPFDEATG